jgi:hypothetical protein
MVKINRVRRGKISRISQGDIFKDVEFIEYIAEKEGIIEISKIKFPLVVVLTQDCDLDEDFKFRWGRARKETQDKFLLSVLVAPLYNVEHVYLGKHLDEIGLKMQPINKSKTPGEKLRQNQTPRYHYLEFPPDIQIVPSVIDFKHYFSMNVQYFKKMKKTNFICNIPPLYREDISHRFANFLSRIGLP